ncbi:hypothetical protein B4U37_01170 [Sutcliffiella horikoshii]|uniref:Uncharacterized protein n=1 Tax=Sutcliffiella horikoshii TaxID=79883 RepID=A0ABN4ZCI7_9BACI|nr:hypothetical protein [Sutcliffiella horikoshii]ART74754.1 hypothetical protein B4U37_01170 [Sutcliffiella horikoshii]
MTTQTSTIHTYEEAVAVIKEVGLLPLAPLFEDYPSLGGMTPKEAWHSDTEKDPWIWRTLFAADGVAVYGKFIKKKAMFISKDLLPLMLVALASTETVEKRYEKGEVSREALSLFSLISENQGIDTRVLRAKAGMKEKEKKKAFDQALLELQGSLDIVVSGTKEKQDENGEKNGWSSTSYETMKHWCDRNYIEVPELKKEEATEKLMNHFESFTSEATMKKLKRVF